MKLEEIGSRAKEVSRVLNNLGSTPKNEGLKAVAQALLDGKDKILEANQKDVQAALAKGMNPGLVDRLSLNDARIQAMAEGLLQVASLDDPVGEVISMKPRPNGLLIGQKRVPLGVIGMIYEARPNVTADAFGLCFKSGNAVILKGGSDALESNKAIVVQIREGLRSARLPEDAVQLIESTDREVTRQFMRLNDYLDVLIPRGSAGLIRSVVENSTVPVIETGTGNCHIYVDKSADIEMAKNIVFNGKTSRPSVCNALETLLVHKDIAEKALPVIKAELDKKNVEIRGCDRTKQILGDCVVSATEEDYRIEFLDYIIAVKVVDSLDDAIAHIQKYSTGHSECIVTSDYNSANEFTARIDSAAVYVNASTRFTDGGEFGLGAEIGISTQKLHARGPMGLNELTSSKYIIRGNGQIR